MPEILLSIAIPTYNRVKFLTENLRILLDQIAAYRQKIQIIVSDNASSEDVASAVNALSAQYDFPIEFYRQEQNLGMNGNSQFVVSKSRGRYVLLMGDDDLLSPNFFDIIMPYLESDKEYALVHWNRLSGDANCSNTKIWDTHYDHMVQELEMLDFVRRTNDSPNFMSSVIFNRQCWDLGLSHVRDNADGYRWFCIIYWGAALLHRPCIYYYLPLSIQRNPPRSYITRFPYYIIVEMSDLFFDLDKVLPGVHAFWQQHLRRMWMWTLPGVSEDRAFYRPVRDHFLPYLNDKERRWLDIWLYAPMPTLIRKVYRRFHKRPK